MNLEKQVQYWREGSQKDMALARTIVMQGYHEQGLFFAHLAIEKLLKAVVCRKINDTAPRLHNLLRLSEMAGLELTNENKIFLADLNSYNLEGRYPTINDEGLGKDQAEKYLAQAEEMWKWLTKKL